MRKNTNKIIAVAILAVLLITTLLGCANGNGKDSIEKTQGEKFTVGFDAGFPPYGYKDDNGEYVGFDLDLAEEVCKRNGWELVKQPIDWDSKDMELNTGTIDCIWSGFTINGREDDYTWSSAYVDNSQVVVVKADSGIRSLNDLKGKNVIVQTDSSALKALTSEDATSENQELAASFKQLIQVSDYNSAFMNLDSKAGDAVCLDIGVAKYQVESRGNSFVILSDKISSEQYGIGFKKGNTALRNQVEKTLEEMNQDGTFNSIARKWEVEEFVCLGQEGADSVMKNETSSKSSTVMDNIKSISIDLGKGMLDSILIFVLTLIFALPLGIGIFGLRNSKLKVLQTIAKVYISIVRGTPLMLQLLVVFFGPYYIFGITLSNSYRIVAVIIGFSLNYAAYFAEIYRSGYESISGGQWEAANMLCYSKSQCFTRIILPQMIKRVLPAMTNEVITLVKDTSLAFVLAYSEIFTIAKQIAAAQTSIIPLFVAGVFYYVFNVLVAFAMSKLEKKLDYYK